jgi:hypothetical protein
VGRVIRIFRKSLLLLVDADFAQHDLHSENSFLLRAFLEFFCPPPALGMTPFHEFDSAKDNTTKDETAIFQDISNFKPESLQFTDKTYPMVRSFISKLLDPNVQTRLGYDGREAVEADPLFPPSPWSDAGLGLGSENQHEDILPLIPFDSIFRESVLESLKTPTLLGFGQY